MSLLTAATGVNTHTFTSEILFAKKEWVLNAPWTSPRAPCAPEAFRCSLQRQIDRELIIQECNKFPVVASSIADKKKKMREFYAVLPGHGVLLRKSRSSSSRLVDKYYYYY